MKTIFSKNIELSILLSAFFVIVLSCSKGLERNGTELDPLTPAKADTSAGSWKTIVLTSVKDVAVAQPEAVTSANYIQELAAVKTAMASLTEEQKTAIRYWNSGGVLRWNQIMRSLVAKNNLPPVEIDGKYPIPSSANPDNTNNEIGTTFPFSNPPYAARSYAYVSVAQYDALVAAMAYKQIYKRKAPNLTDASIVPSLVSAPGGATSYSYPSEDAVLAGASYELMKRLFPRTEDTLYLYKMKEQQKWYKVWSGAATKSDIEAGEKLGKAVALKVVARFGNDGMKNAVGNQAKWDSLFKRAEERGDVAWKSMEEAPRPPMLPLFGNVKTWNMDFATMKDISTRFPPYNTKSEEFKKDLAEVRAYSDKPTRENIAIVHYWADGAGTHTPPGHWNQIAEEYIANDRESEVRAARNYALLNTAMMDAAVSCWYTKNFFYTARPSQMDPEIKTLTGLPNFQSYTSGHSTFSASAATVLGYLFPSAAGKFNSMADEASKSRLVGCIHYRIDCEGGLKIGKLVGDQAVKRGQSDGSN